jgi:hypothetical protein
MADCRTRRRDSGIDGGVVDVATAGNATELAGALVRTAREVLRVCGVTTGERILVLSDEATAPELSDAFNAALQSLGPAADPVVLTSRPRQPAFADLPGHAVDALLAADFVLDLTTSPWLYSDSFTRFVRECDAAGTRLAMVWGTPESLRTNAACPPSARLAEQSRRGLEALKRARNLHARSIFGTDFTVELGDPGDYPRGFIGEPPVRDGMIGAPLCASVTAPVVPGTARGRLAFRGAGRFQGPENLALRADQPVQLTIESGRVAQVEAEHPAAIALADWFARAGKDDGSIVMDCNVGFDPRAELDWADNTVVHSFAGGLMIGFGNPYEYRPEGSHRPGFHLDLMFRDLDVDLDDIPFIRHGRFTPESGVL